MRKRRVVGRICGMKYSWKGHNDRNRHKNRIKRVGKLGWFMSKARGSVSATTMEWCTPHHTKGSPRGPATTRQKNRTNHFYHLQAEIDLWTYWISRAFAVVGLKTIDLFITTTVGTRLKNSLIHPYYHRREIWIIRALQESPKSPPKKKKIQTYLLKNEIWTN